jgi:hypothetical protein
LQIYIRLYAKDGLGEGDAVNPKRWSLRAAKLAGWVVLESALLAACSHSHPATTHDAGIDTPTGKLGTTVNLIVNGNAESAAGSSSGSVIASSIPGWTTSGNANILTYGASGGYPTLTDPGPADRGANFFSGGPNDTPSTFTQHIDLGAYVGFIARGNVRFKLSAYLGGYADQDDNAVLKVAFFGANRGNVPDGGIGSNPLSVVTLGPVLAADRNENTGLLARATTGPVPAQATSADVQLTMTRAAGTANDGYADSLILRLTDEPSPGDAGAASDAQAGADGPGPAITSVVIDSTGGTLALSGMSLVVPPGALTAATTISVAPQPAPPDTNSWHFLSPVFEFGPDGLDFAIPATLSIDMPASGGTPGVTGSIAYLAADGTITPLPSQPTASGMSAGISHFSPYSFIEPFLCTNGACTFPAICCSNNPPGPGVCLDITSNDAQHCGGCTTDCAKDLVNGPGCCHGMCFNTMTNATHCGLDCQDCISKGGGCLHGRCAPCPTQIKVIDVPCPTADICHGTIGTNKACDRCIGTQVQDCSGNPLQPASMACCDQCPSDANRANDLPCDPPPMDDSSKCAAEKPNGCP